MKLISTMLAIVMIFAIASIALARGAPTKQKAFTAQAVVVTEAPVIARVSVPPMTVGYDVIQNLATVENSYIAVTTAATRLSTTGDNRGLNANSTATARSSPIQRILLA